jgi:exopolysaccharide biosynthesis polyprenyl glycosylphosphotransferase
MLGLLLALGAFGGLVILGNFARRLYAEAVADRAHELMGLVRSCFVAAILLVFAGQPLHRDIPWRPVAVAAGVCLFFLIAFRSFYRARITARRRANESVRSCLVIGTNDEALQLCTLLQEDSAFGYRPAGVVGDPGDYDRHEFDVPWLGDVDSALTAARAGAVRQVFVARSALSVAEFTRLSRTLTSHGIHVAAASGLPGIDQRRLRIMPISKMPTFSLDASQPSRWDDCLKRTLDIALTVPGLLVALPLMAVVALAILILDGRPILFRQQRVGRHGVPFTIYKFRTMVRDADLRVIDLREQNERQGPLFKVTKDPRVSRMGKILRGSKIDELPQLFNVLQGKMSLVGPRPALVRETEQFSEELLERHNLRPGITGLWQVEAGDDPSFVLYQRLDLFYVGNWSLALDVAILLATLPTVGWQMYDRLKRAKAKRVAAGAEAPPTVSQMREAGAEVLDLLAAQATVVVLSGPAVEGSR